jgi:hypothetical protein
LSVALAGIVGVSSQPADAFAPSSVSSGPALTEREALSRAAASDAPVEVLAERTEASQVFAEPDGRLSLEVGVVPQWVRQADGSWRDVDLNLDRGSGGCGGLGGRSRMLVSPRGVRGRWRRSCGTGTF